MRRSSRHILIRWLRRRVFPHKLSCRVTSLRGYSSTSQDRQKEGDMVMQAQGGLTNVRKNPYAKGINLQDRCNTAETLILELIDVHR